MLSGCNKSRGKALNFSRERQKCDSYRVIKLHKKGDIHHNQLKSVTELKEWL